MRLYLAFFIILSVFLSANKCSKEIQKSDIYNTWLHSFEEDNGDIKVYRPNTYNFPPARGRKGFTIARNGEFVLHEIAPTDGLDSKKGTWKMKGDKVIEVTMNESGEKFDLTIYALQDGVLSLIDKR